MRVLRIGCQGDILKMDGKWQARPAAAGRRVDRRFTRSVCLAVIACCLLGTVQADTPVGADRVYSRTRQFKIPFEYDQQDLARLGAAKIQLFQSGDAGQSWQLVNEVDPGMTAFTLNAANEQEYWFSLRTLLANGETLPTGPHHPGLRVTVDATPPMLKLDVTEIKSGEVELSWSATDQYLDSSSLAIEVRDSATGLWVPVTVNGSATGTQKFEAVYPGLVELRGQVQDFAGNKSSVTAQTIVSGVTNPTPGANGPAEKTQSRAIAVKNPASGPSQNSGNGSFVRSNRPIAAVSDVTGKDLSRPQSQPKTTGQKRLDLSELPADTQSNRTPLSASMNSQSAEFGLPVDLDTMLSQNQVAPQTDVNAQAETRFRNADQGIARSLENNQAGNVPTKPVVDTSVPLTTQTPLSDSKLSNDSAVGSSLPPSHHRSALPLQGNPPVNAGPMVHHVNTLEFLVEYAVGGIDSQQIRQIDVFITEDEGRSWFFYGRDDDRRSPVQVRVPRVGTYGLAFRIQDRLGTMVIPPQPGEPPTISIVVDQTLPEAEVRLRPILQRNGHYFLPIEWTATDRELHPLPIAISMRTTVADDWQFMDGWMTNSGSMLLPLEGEPTSPPLLRLHVRDLAGNIATVSPPEVLPVIRARP